MEDRAERARPRPSSLHAGTLRGTPRARNPLRIRGATHRADPFEGPGSHPTHTTLRAQLCAAPPSLLSSRQGALSSRGCMHHPDAPTSPINACRACSDLAQVRARRVRGPPVAAAPQPPHASIALSTPAAAAGRPRVACTGSCCARRPGAARRAESLTEPSILAAPSRVESHAVRVSEAVVNEHVILRFLSGRRVCIQYTVHRACTVRVTADPSRVTDA